MLRSQYRVVTPIVLLLTLFADLILSVLSYIGVSKFIANETKPLIILIIPLFTSFVLLLTIYHLKFTWDVIEIGNEELRIKELFGLGKVKAFSYNELKATPSYESVKIGSG